MKYCIVTVLIITVLLQLSCNKQTTCLQDARIIANIKFTTTNDTLAIIDTPLPKPIIISDTFGFLGNEKTKTTSFILNSIADSMDIVFAADSKAILPKYDTIHLVYDRQLHFISKDCGYNYYYTLLNVTSTKHVLKKASIIQPLINDNTNNVPHLSFLF